MSFNASSFLSMWTRIFIDYVALICIIRMTINKFVLNWKFCLVFCPRLGVCILDRNVVKSKSMTSLWIHIFTHVTSQKMKFSIKDFFSQCDQIRSFLENFIFCAVYNRCSRKRLWSFSTFLLLKLPDISHLIFKFLLMNIFFDNYVQLRASSASSQWLWRACWKFITHQLYISITVINVYSLQTNR